MVTEDHFPDLLDLIRLGVRPPWLEVQDFLHTIHPEDVVVASDSAAEPEALHQGTQAVEGDVRVPAAEEDVLIELLVSAHFYECTLVQSLCQHGRGALAGDGALMFGVHGALLESYALLDEF